MRGLRRFWCGLRGHDLLPKFEHDRIYLKCMSCDHETPGWDLNEIPPTVTQPNERQPRWPSLVRIA